MIELITVLLLIFLPIYLIGKLILAVFRRFSRGNSTRKPTGKKSTGAKSVKTKKRTTPAQPATSAQTVEPASEAPVEPVTIPGIHIITPEAEKVVSSHSQYFARILSPDSYYKPWQSDPVTDRQIEALTTRGISVTDQSLVTKGLASYLIGMFSSYEGNPDSDLLLKANKIQKDSLTETAFGFIYNDLINDPDALKRAAEEPATDLQKIFFDFHGIKRPAKLTFNEAAKIMADYEYESMTNAQIDRWGTVESWWEDLCDPDLRKDSEIKKIPAKRFIEIAGEFVRQSPDAHFYDFVDHVHEKHPELKRTTS